MNDLTPHSDSELSLVVFNDEFFYDRRHGRGFTESLNEFLVYTPAQMDELKQDLEDDLEEIEGED